MQLTADKLYQLGLIDAILAEPLGGAHRQYGMIAETVQRALERQIAELTTMPLEVLLEQRYQRLLSYGYSSTASSSAS